MFPPGIVIGISGLDEALFDQVVQGLVEELHDRALIMGEAVVGADEAVEGGQGLAEQAAEGDEIEPAIRSPAGFHDEADVEAQDADLLAQADEFSGIDSLQLGFFELAGVEAVLAGVAVTGLCAWAARGRERGIFKHASSPFPFCWAAQRPCIRNFSSRPAGRPGGRRSR